VVAEMTQHLSDVQAVPSDQARPLPPLEEPGERVIVPAKRRLKLRDIFGEVSVIRVLATRDYKIKYKQSLLGPLWLVFQPLALLAAFVVAFHGLGDIGSSGTPYAVFSLVGLTVWGFFQASMTIGVASLITNAAFIRFTPCPRPAFPLAAIIASLPSFAVTAAAATVSAAATGHLSPRVVLLPLGLAWLLLLTAGIVGTGAALAVRYRDMISALPFLLQVGIFFAPVGYALAALSPWMRKIVELNPLTGLIETFRWIMLSGYSPSAGAIIAAVVETSVLAVVGWRVFARLETTMADEI
jgi:ABC-type polysaccharide/polyol phosphate export permease